MSSPDAIKDRAQTGAAKAQAQKLLRTMCNFMLPLIQRAGGQKTNKLQKMPLGIEADEFVIALEKFISGVILYSQLPRSHDTMTIETQITSTLNEDSFHYLEGTSWLWDIPAPEGGSNHDNRKLKQFPLSRRIAAPRVNYEDGLQHLRSYITQTMPIRLLCFQPHDSILKISLLERADVYNYLAPKLRAAAKSDAFRLSIDDWIHKHTQYAILSHTWTQNPGELTYRDWRSGSLDDNHPKCRKLVNFCKAAWEDYGITLGWIDTVCINKESSAELDESIRSMYAWYRDAKVCITYLAGSGVIWDMHNDPWFTRGWTLQELVAPRCIKFYNMYWNQLSGDTSSESDDKANISIQDEIRLATTIKPDELQPEDIQRTSISRKMQLVAKRQVTRAEDIAYCLMGIFDVSISTAYGEGAERAFFRLVEEIFRSTKDVSDIFNWAGDRNLVSWQPPTSLFPSRPSNYLNRLTNEVGPGSWRSWRPIKPLTLTHLGLRTPILLMPAVPSQDTIPYYRPIGDYYATVYTPVNQLLYPQYYRLLDKDVSENVSEPEGLYELPWGQKITLTFGTLNVEEQGTSTRIPKTCLAVLLQRHWNEATKMSSAAYEKVSTEQPIVFDLEKTGNNSDDDGDKHYYQIERNQLAKHGMQLVTLYL